VEEDSWIKIESKLYRLNNVLNGVNEYFPVLFTKESASLFNCMVHSTILEFKARKMPLWKMH